MKQHQIQVLKFAFQKHWRKHSLKILISLTAFYFWNIARETVTTPYELVLLDEQVDQSIRMLSVEPADQTIPLHVDTPAQPVGGLKVFNQYIIDNIRYPKEAHQAGVSGRVLASFVVKKDGSVGQIKIVKGIGSGCDQEVIRLMENSPKWIPASHEGEAVSQQLIFPIRFGKNG